MESLPLQNSSKEIDISAEKMILFSPQRKKLDSLNPIKLKRPAYLTSQLSGSLTGRTKDPMHETYKKLIRQRHPTIQISLGTIDFSGKGEIVEDDIINFYKKFHLDYTDEQIKDYLRKYSLLTDDGKIDKAMMAKVYYGHHFRNNFETPGLVTAVANSASNKELTSKSLSELNTVVTHRLKRIESMIKTKISSNWNQVRKAFLDIDNDYDGYITAKDFWELWGGAFELNEVKLLMKHRGIDQSYKIDFNKFWSWFGSTLAPYEGFFFRHDSLHNPEYSLIMKKTKDAHNKAIDEFSKALKQRSLTDLIVDKITQQWKSIKTAFIKMNCEKSGYIEKDELKVILQNWGFYLDDEKFDEVYSAFDRDKDGIINYADFKYAIGYRIQPEEYLYFRQDNPNTINLNPKEQKNWWKELPNVNRSEKNPFQFKIGIEKAESVIHKLKSEIGDDKWNELINSLKDKQSYSWSDFEDLFIEIGRPLMKKENNTLRSIVWDFSEKGSSLNVKKLKYLNDLQNDDQAEIVLEEEDYEEKDNCTIYGFLSKTRKEEITENISEEQLIKIILEKNPDKLEHNILSDVLKTIKSIDTNKNGYVSYLELTNCFKNHYETELFGKSLSKILKPFWSVQNKILINYNQFIDHLKKKMNQYMLNNDQKFGQLSKIKSLDILKPLSPNLINAKRLVVDQQDLEFETKDDFLKMPEILKTERKQFVMSPVPKSRNIPSIAESRISMRSTMFKNSPNRMHKLNGLSTKLGYEWKFIYRELRQHDSENTGKCDTKLFMKTLHNHRVILNSEEWRAWKSQFLTTADTQSFLNDGNMRRSITKEGTIDYLRLSKELNLHKLSYDYIIPTDTMRKKLKMASTVYGSDTFSNRKF